MPIPPFKIAIICALPLEADAVEALFDEVFPNTTTAVSKSPGDANAYSTGRIGHHHVVVAHMPGRGKRSAASVAANLRNSFPDVTLALVVGVCGGVPLPFGTGSTSSRNEQGVDVGTIDGKPEAFRTESTREIILGDVVISDGVVEYDFGRRLPDGFRRMDTLRESLGRPNLEIRALLSKLKTKRTREDLSRRTKGHLDELSLKMGEIIRDPGREADILYNARYRHKHHVEGCVLCSGCLEPSDPVCDLALESSCTELDCDGKQIIQRQRLSSSLSSSEIDTRSPEIHIGTIASGDTVMKSGRDRDELAARANVIAFEMEGAGVWGILPCLVIKGVCDYADAHKSKVWQNYAAATAAACTKAFLEEWAPKPREPIHKIVWSVPFERNEHFVGRDEEMKALLGKLFTPGRSSRAVAVGLGGIGKTALVLELAHRVHEDPKHATCSIFWVPAASSETFHQGYLDIGRKLEIAGIEEPDADVKSLVRDFLSEEKAGDWMMIFDNADDIGLWFEKAASAERLADYIPKSSKGSIVMTTRNRQVATKFAPQAIVSVEEMTQDTSALVLENLLINAELTEDQDATKELLSQLSNLPLAIVQAAAYINMTDISLAEYLELLKETEDSFVEVLAEDFEDEGRYPDQKNPIATTWLVSFEEIRKRKPLAADYLAFMSCLDPRGIPTTLLPDTSSTKLRLEAISTLVSYSFAKKKLDQTLDIHRLVHLVMRNWLKSEDSFLTCLSRVADRLSAVFPTAEQENVQGWRKLLTHAGYVLKLQEENSSSLDLSLLENYGCALMREERFREAQPLLKKLVETQRALTIHDAITLRSIANLAMIYRRQEILDQAEILDLEALALSKTLGNVIDELNCSCNLAETYCEQERYDEAMPVLTRALDDARTLADDHPVVIRATALLAFLYSELGFTKEAEQMEAKIVEASKLTLGSDHPDTLTAMSNLADSYRNGGKFDDALRLDEEVLQSFLRTRGPNHPDTFFAKYSLASTYEKLLRFNEAEELKAQALDGYIKAYGKYHSVTLTVSRSLVETYQQLGKHDEAEALLMDVVQGERQMLGRDDSEASRAIEQLLQLRQTSKQNDHDQAVAKTLDLENDESRDRESDKVLVVGTQALCIKVVKQGTRRV